MSRTLAMQFINSRKFKEREIFTAKDICKYTKTDAFSAYNAIEVMMSEDWVVRISRDEQGNNRYVRTNQASKILRLKWRKENCGELAYYKGMHFFGNADTGWRPAL